MFRKKYGFINVNNDREKTAIRIVSDGAISHPDVADGKLIPLVILDTTNRPDLSEFIRAHLFLGAGDVSCQWGQMIDHPETVCLILTFARPSQLVAAIEFSIPAGNGIIVEHILAAKALYIQAGKEGDLLRDNLDAPKVILEVPDTKFRRIWDKIHYSYSFKQFRRHGLNRRAAKKAAQEFIENVRKAAVLRTPV
ncbi:hypothetical protein [Nitrospirillum amazonense]|uniref:hypothetical protein n=1 Tax=Nitrospirillum amazonense TaxID=28077 RepID=UPI0011AA3C62|nr:hypothetical protein [Nitrospirillum amazonense]